MGFTVSVKMMMMKLVDYKKKKETELDYVTKSTESLQQFRRTKHGYEKTIRKKTTSYFTLIKN